MHRKIGTIAKFRRRQLYSEHGRYHKGRYMIAVKDIDTNKLFTMLLLLLQVAFGDHRPGIIVTTFMTEKGKLGSI